MGRAAHRLLNEDAWNGCDSAAMLLSAAELARVDWRRAILAALTAARAGIGLLPPGVVRDRSEARIEIGFAWLFGSASDTALRFALDTAGAEYPTDNNSDSDRISSQVLYAVHMALPLTEDISDHQYFYARLALEELSRAGLTDVAGLVRAEALPWSVVDRALLGREVSEALEAVRR